MCARVVLFAVCPDSVLGLIAPSLQLDAFSVKKKKRHMFFAEPSGELLLGGLTGISLDWPCCTVMTSCFKFCRVFCCCTAAH